jgi:hypothetical protein
MAGGIVLIIFTPVRTCTHLAGHLTHEVPPCQMTTETQGRRNRDQGQHRLSAQSLSRAASRCYRLRPAQRTQRKLPDQLWASLAWRLFIFSSPSSLPQKHDSRIWVVCSTSSFVLKRLTLLQWTDLVFPICAQHIVTGVHPPRVTQWHIGRAHEMCLSMEGSLHYLFHVLSQEDKHTVLLALKPDV